jgi:hypothetical protein
MPLRRGASEYAGRDVADIHPTERAGLISTSKLEYDQPPVRALAAGGTNMTRLVARIAAIACFSASVAVTALWVRSYTWCDSLLHMSRESAVPPVARWGRFISLDGRIEFQWMRMPNMMLRPGAPVLSLNRREVEEGRNLAYPRDRQRQASFAKSMGFSSHRSSRYLVFTVPHWILVVLGGAVAAALVRLSAGRFSLRFLLAVVTCMAVCLGAVAALLRVAPDA